LLRIKKMFFHDNPSIREIARAAELQPETVSRIINGHQKPSFAPNGSAERIARALGWKGDVRALFVEEAE